jgi:GT2 family glycosyltransferase
LNCGIAGSSVDDSKLVMDLSIIIVNWKSKDYLNTCLESIRKWSNDLSIEIVVIDSGSFDGCAEMLRDHHPSVRFIQNDQNLGFATANNVAFRVSTGKYILFLNPDTEVIAHAIGTMYEHLERSPLAGAVGCRLLNSDGSLQTSCVQSFPTIFNQFFNAESFRGLFPKSRLWGMATLFADNNEPSEVEAVSGACLMMRRTTFDEVGLFSENYFMYAEDVDLCYKAQRAGYRNYYVPQATVIHFGGSSSQQRPSEFSVIMMRSSIWDFLRRSKGELYALGYRASTLMAALGRIGCLLLLLPVYVTRGRLQAWLGSVRKWRAISIWSVGLKRPTAHSS